MVCNKCGAENEQGAVFCGSCGAKLEETVVENTSTTQQESAVGTEARVSLNKTETSSNETKDTNNESVSFDYSYSTTNNGVDNNANQNQGFQNQGMPNQGFQNQGMPNQGFQNQGMPNQGFQNQGMPNQGFQNQGMPNQGFQNQGMPRKPMSNAAKVLIGTIAAAVVAFVVFVCVGNSQANYSNTADRYYKAVTNYDYKTINKYADAEDKSFLTEKNFKESFDLDKKFQGKLVNKEDDNRYDFPGRKTRKYNIETKNGKKGTLTLAGTESKSRSFIFFKKWNIDCGQVVSRKVTMLVPKNAKLYINGVEVSRKYITNKSSSSETYTIPALYAGQYKLSVKVKGRSKITVTRIIGSKVVVGENPSSFISLTRLSLSDNDQKDLLKKAKKDFTKIVQSAQMCDDYSKVKKYFGTSSSYEYDDLCDDFTHSNYEEGKCNMQFTSMEADVIDNSSEHPSVRIKLEGKCDEVVGRVEGTTLSNIEKDKDIDGHVSISYKYDEKKGWVITRISFFVL
ncbi:zinc-ribbon domain-containing protein [Lachnobacterium bovis]|uniref:Pentapeptide repeat-containing protein n=1 Tax=Lachnobacterium bovis DSM 14045 TaxID=1122142 RepID=A0A1H3I149_9FIRM|nr:zinc-ribbon domain-containing protein [Lachnobacterium bovis]SDY21430.1 Pentapeptide repeat-containing protein [Lachnobacterium bovis DSM 14045]